MLIHRACSTPLESRLQAASGTGWPGLKVASKSNRRVCDGLNRGLAERIQPPSIDPPECASNYVADLWFRGNKRRPIIHGLDGADLVPVRIDHIFSYIINGHMDGHFAQLTHNLG